MSIPEIIVLRTFVLSVVYAVFNLIKKTFNYSREISQFFITAMIIHYIQKFESFNDFASPYQKMINLYTKLLFYIKNK